MERQDPIPILHNNCEALRLTFNTLQSIIRDSTPVSEKLHIAYTSKRVYELWEVQKEHLRQLGSSPPSTEFSPAAIKFVPRSPPGQ